MPDPQMYYSQYSCIVHTAIVSILQMRNLKFRKVVTCFGVNLRNQVEAGCVQSLSSAAGLYHPLVVHLVLLCLTYSLDLGWIPSLSSVRSNFPSFSAPHQASFPGSGATLAALGQVASGAEFCCTPSKVLMTLSPQKHCRWLPRLARDSQVLVTFVTDLSIFLCLSCCGDPWNGFPGSLYCGNLQDFYILAIQSVFGVNSCPNVPFDLSLHHEDRWSE